MLGKLRLLFKPLILILFTTFGVSASFAQEIKVEVLEKVGIRSFVRVDGGLNEPLRVGVEIYNVGSLPIKPSLRLIVCEKYIIWSSAKLLFPRERSVSTLYFYLPNFSSQCKANLRIYYAGEIEDKEMNVSLLFNKNFSNPFFIRRVSVYENEIKLWLESQAKTKVIIHFYDLPLSARAEQKVVEIEKGLNSITIPFQSLTELNQEGLIIYSEDGNYLLITKLKLKKASKFGKLIDIFWDLLAHVF